MIDRLPIRLRLTLPFAVVMAVALAVTGFFIYGRVAGTLLADVDKGLRGQAKEAATRAEENRNVVDRDSPGGPTVGQLLAADGTVLLSTPKLPALVVGDSLQRVVAGRAELRSVTIPGLGGRWRILAVPVRVRGSREAIVLAASLASRDETLDRLTREFLIAGPAALLIAILAGYGLAAAALRPVEAMRRRAASITGSTAGSRLPIPRSRDEVSRLAETLNDMLGRLEGALEHERRFVDDASHELRTPLALLRTELELALRHRRSHEELEQALRSAAEETERLTRLAEDLLLVARFDEGVLPIRREAIEARSLIENVASRYELRLRQAGRSLALDAPAGLCIDADAARLGQALGNLVENAVVHGGGAIGLSARASDGRVELHVTDEGPGVPPDFLPRAFDRFSRADDARGRGGTGLGLAIVEVIARAHGGAAGLVNRPGAGTDAWITVGRVLSNL